MSGPYPQLIIDTDGDACITDGREFDLVALPACDHNGAILNPNEWVEMVRRFNNWPALSAALATERARVAELEAELTNAVCEAHETGFEREKWKARAEAAEAKLNKTL